MKAALWTLTAFSLYLLALIIHHVSLLQTRVSALEHPPIVQSPSPSPQGTPVVNVK